LLGVLQRRAARQLLEQAGRGVHRAHHLRHRLQGPVRRADDDVDALTEDVQFGVGDEGGHLDERVVRQREAGHLAVDPHHAIVHGPNPTGSGGSGNRAVRPRPSGAGAVGAARWRTGASPSPVVITARPGTPGRTAEGAGGDASGPFRVGAPTPYVTSRSAARGRSPGWGRTPPGRPPPRPPGPERRRPPRAGTGAGPSRPGAGRRVPAGPDGGPGGPPARAGNRPGCAGRRRRPGFARPAAAGPGRRPGRPPGRNPAGAGSDRAAPPASGSRSGPRPRPPSSPTSPAGAAPAAPAG